MQLGAGAFLLAALLLSCGRAPAAAPVHDGPIVLVTLGSLRADVVGGLGGEPGLTPHLDALIRQADWAGRAVAASSWGAPAMAALWTGLRPWQHQVLHAGRAHLAAELLTLPEALQAAGYRTAGYPGGVWYSQEHGYADGFDTFEPGSKGREPVERLRRLGPGRWFVWVHIPEPQAPYMLRRRLLPRLDGRSERLPRELPSRIRPLQLEAYFDPSVPLPEGKRRRFWAMYLLNVAWADEKLGRLVEALRAGGQWDRTLFVVTADHGEEFRERGQIANGGNLGRQLLEVPLVVKLPQGSALRIPAPQTERVAAARLWATLVEAAGGPAAPLPPAVAPSLWREASWPALSELYLGNGTNRFSLVEGDYQLLWESRFAPPEPEYYRARLKSLAGHVQPPLSEPAEQILGRLESAFAAAPPLSGDGAPRLTLERWGGRGSEPVDDPRRTAAMARRLAAAWQGFVVDELTPGQEARERGEELARGPEPPPR